MLMAFLAMERKDDMGFQTDSDLCAFRSLGGWHGANWQGGGSAVGMFPPYHEADAD